MLSNIETLPYSELLALWQLSKKMIRYYRDGDVAMRNNWINTMRSVYKEMDRRLVSPGKEHSGKSISEFLNMPIEKIGLSPQAYNPIKAQDCKTIRDMLKLEYRRKRGLLHLRNFGPVSMAEAWNAIANKLLELE